MEHKYRLIELLELINQNISPRDQDITRRLLNNVGKSKTHSLLCSRFSTCPDNVSPDIRGCTHCVGSTFIPNDTHCTIIELAYEAESTQSKLTLFDILPMIQPSIDLRKEYVKFHDTHDVKNTLLGINQECISYADFLTTVKEK